jgi:hypothetical protein
MTSERSPEMDAFVADAKAVSLLDGFSRAGGSLAALRRTGAEWIGPCPACGGKDRFSLNEAKQVFNCRGAGGGGVISLAMHVSGAGFLDACEMVLGQDRPGLDSAGRAVRDHDRRAAASKIEAQRAEAERLAVKRAAEAEHFRDREWQRCADDWNAAGPFSGSPAEAYLAARRLPMPDAAFVRCHAGLPYWGGPSGRQTVLHRGPAMLVLFVVPGETQYRPIGMHRTWIALDRAPKFRPDIVDPESGAALASKKMRGSKMGGFLPLLGRLSAARRMVAGEGIETVLGYAAEEGFPEGTFYCAAGDLGNLCGKAERTSRLKVPGAFKLDRAGRKMPVVVPGELPDWDSACLPVPDHIEELLLVGDGDSEPVMTRAAMKRGVARHARPGRGVEYHMAPAGLDWAEIGAGVAA